MLEYLRDLNLVSICLRILLTLLVGGVLGIERGSKNRPAGFRTYVLVCLGACLVMMTNQFVYQQYNTSDPVRMGAQVISGIGFLGAGTIMVTRRNQIKGMTTAAGLWTAACCGLAIGIGFYEGALLGGIALFFVMSTLRRMDAYIHQHSKAIELYVELQDGGPLSDFLQYVRDLEFDVLDIQMKKTKMMPDAGVCAVLSLESRRKRTHVEMVTQLSIAPGVLFVEEL